MSFLFLLSLRLSSTNTNFKMQNLLKRADLTRMKICSKYMYVQNAGKGNLNMVDGNVDKKEKSITIRISKTQIESIAIAKGSVPRISNTDILMSGVNLLRMLIEKCQLDDKSYDELLNALLIHDDILRCMAKPENSQVNNVKDNQVSLDENEKKIIFFLRNIINKC